MTAVEMLLLQFDYNLQHRWESLDGVLKELTEEEARWQAPCYAKEAQEDGFPQAGTILWHIAHLSFCNRYYVEVLRRRPDKEIPEPAKPGRPSLSTAVEELLSSHAALREEAAKLKEAHLDDLCGNDRTVVDFLSACLRHEIWHGGQIAIARRLYRTR